MVRGLVYHGSASGQILTSCEQRRLIPLLSKAVLYEYLDVLLDPELTNRYPQLTPEKIESVLSRLSYIGDRIRGARKQFKFPRDPKDEKIVDLAFAGRASHIITCDRDLLDLPHGNDAAARNFRRLLPRVVVLEPEDALRRLTVERLNSN